MNPTDLYNLEPSQFRNKLEGYNAQRKEDQFYQALYSFKIALHIRDKKGFSFDDFTDALPWMAEEKDKSMQSQLEWRDEQVRLYELEHGNDD